MPRGNGSYLGQTVNPNSNAASGIWTVREAEAYLRADKWPAQPTVPSAPTGTAGNGQVALTWTAPTSGSPPTDYIVQYSSNGGSSWTTFSDGVSAATSATVTGLTNGTGYIFRVKAVNALGEGPAGSASGTITPSEISVSLLLHFDGTNGSTTLTDSSGNNLAVTATGSAQISTAESKFGGASLALNGLAVAVVSGGAGFTSFGSGDFTAECWFYSPTGSNVSLGCFMTTAHLSTDGAGFFVGPQDGDSIQWLFGDGEGPVSGWAFSRIATGAFSPDTWNHLAITRHDGVAYLFVNGVVVDSVADSTNVTHPDNLLAIGGRSIGGAQQFAGYIDELRIVKGTAVYTANFTPPTAPF